VADTKLVIVATHPIQYHIPWYRELSDHDDLDVTVLYGLLPTEEQQSTGFGTKFSWDIPLTDNYPWEQLNNIAEPANLSSFAGVDCPEVYDVLKRLAPDAIIITGWHSKLLLQVLFASRRLNVKTIMRGDSNAKKPRPWYIRLAHRLLLSRYDAFLAVGESNARFFLNNGVKPHQIFDAPYFVENQRFVNGALNPRSDIHDIQTSKDSFCFIYAGKLISKKNVQELLTAFKICYQKNRSIQMLIIGAGALRSELETYAIKQKLPVKFLGFVNQKSLPSTYALGDCFLLASDFDETWGLVVNEAMACGLPAIVSDRAGCSDDLIIDSKTGFTYPFGSPKILAEKMTYMIENKDEAKAMGLLARGHILDRYNVKNSVLATLGALSSIGRYD
jgi:glycosyltransferase involved in cell wall biosynthesis